MLPAVMCITHFADQRSVQLHRCSVVLTCCVHICYISLRCTRRLG
jgi:hypothetical protein